MKPLKKENLIVIDYLKRFPRTNKTALARLICNNHPEFFKDVERVRFYIRWYMGKAGARSKIHEEKPLIPEPEPRRYEQFYTIPHGKYLVISDIHFPYHDQFALDLAIEDGIRNEVNGVLLNGDILDMYQCSNFVKDPRNWSASQEIEIGKEFLKLLRYTFPKAKVFYKMGNHEERFEVYLKRNAAALYGIEEFRLEYLLKFNDFNVGAIHGRQIIKAGKLLIAHGHELQRGIAAPVNPARGAFNKTKSSCLVSHHHQTSEHTEKALNGNMVTCWSIGCLSDLMPDYAPSNKYNHGFAILEIFQDGSYNVDNKRIHNHRIL